MSTTSSPNSTPGSTVGPIPSLPEPESLFRPLSPLPSSWKSLAHAFIGQARKSWHKPCISDSTGLSLTYGRALIGATAMARVLASRISPVPYVAIMLPPTVAGALANLAVTLMGRIPVNLNYSASKELVDASVRQCGATHVISSKKVLDRFGFVPAAEMIDLEDVKKQINTPAKLVAAAAAKLAPLPLLQLLLPGAANHDLQSPATVIFTSGSTGDPKGVILTHENILSNIHQIDQQVVLHPNEVVIGILPFFHSFGFTVTIWTVLCLGLHAVYHYNPLEARTIGKLAEKHAATVLFGTPTFLRGYIRKCGPEQFKTVRLPILGAEKLKPEVAADIQKGLGILPYEGYGCTETGPVVAVNIPDRITLPDGRVMEGNHPGTVGTPVPGTRIKTTDPDTGTPLPIGQEGMVHVKGPQVMAGYLNQPELTAKVLRDGWYCTGDLGFLDADGFLHITGRLSRFSKIGGEMVPHEKVESIIAEMVGNTAEDQVPHVAVTAVPDERRGERLIVVHTGLPVDPPEICRRLVASSIPRLWIPEPDDFLAVESLPVLATGKLDLRHLRDLALARAQGAPSTSSPSR